MNISEMKSNIKYGFARPNLFRVKIAEVGATDQLGFRINCYQAQIPGSNLATTDKDSGFRSAAYHKIYADIILGFYCSTDMKELQFFQNWIDMIINPVTNRKGYYSVDPSNPLSPGYTSTVTIEQLTRISTKGGEHDLNYTQKNQPKLSAEPYKREKELYTKKGMSSDAENVVSARWTLLEAYPKQIDPIQLDYGTNDTIMSMNVTLTYRIFKQVFHPTPDYDSVDMGEETINWLDQRGAGGAARRGEFGM